LKDHKTKEATGEKREWREGYHKEAIVVEKVSMEHNLGHKKG